MSVEQKRNPDRYLFYAFLALVVWLPLPFGANRPMYWWVAELGFNIIMFSWVFLWWRNDVNVTSAFKKAWVGWWLVIFFMLFVAVQMWGKIPQIISIDPHATEDQWLKSLMVFEAFALTMLLVNSHRRVNILAVTLLLAGTFQAVYGTLIAISGAEVIWNKVNHTGGSATGTFINRNHFAGYLEMTLAIGLGLLIANLETTKANTWREHLRRLTKTFLGPKIQVRVCLALMVIGLILSHSRMGNTAFFASMMIAGAVGLLLFRKSGRGVVMLFSSLIIIDIFLMGTFFGIDKLQDRIEQTNVKQEQRIDAAILTLDIIKDYPIAGTGFGTFYTAFPHYRNEKISIFYDHTHNDLAEFTSDLGIVGVTPLALIWLLSFYYAIMVQVKRRSQLMKAMGFAATMAMIAIFIHSWSDFNLQISANAVTFMIILALPYVAATVDRQGSN